MGKGELTFSCWEVIFFFVVVVPTFCFVFFVVSIQFGRLLERDDAANSSGVEFSLLGALDNMTQEFLDTGALGRGRGRGRGGGRQNFFWPEGVTGVGLWVGSGGQPFSMRGASAPHLHSIVVYHSGGAIHSIACDYTVPACSLGLPHPYYGSTAVRSEIELPSGEHITAVEGTTGHFANVSGVVITSLTFHTSSGTTYGPYGSVGSHNFSVLAADGACIVGFWGRSGWLLDAIGVYISLLAQQQTRRRND